jgi:hypothetical protein
MNEIIKLPEEEATKSECLSYRQMSLPGYEDFFQVGYSRHGCIMADHVVLSKEQIAALAEGAGIFVSNPELESMCDCVRLGDQCRALLENPKIKCAAWGLIVKNLAKYDGRCRCDDCGRVICSDCQ